MRRTVTSHRHVLVRRSQLRGERFWICPTVSGTPAVPSQTGWGSSSQHCMANAQLYAWCSGCPSLSRQATGLAAPHRMRASLPWGDESPLAKRLDQVELRWGGERACPGLVMRGLWTGCLRAVLCLLPGSGKEPEDWWRRKKRGEATPSPPTELLGLLGDILVVGPARCLFISNPLSLGQGGVKVSATFLWQPYRGGGGGGAQRTYKRLHPMKVWTNQPLQYTPDTSAVYYPPPPPLRCTIQFKQTLKN